MRPLSGSKGFDKRWSSSAWETILKSKLEGKYQSPGYDRNPYRSQFPFSTSPFRAGNLLIKKMEKSKNSQGIWKRNLYPNK